MVMDAAAMEVVVVFLALAVAPRVALSLRNARLSSNLTPSQPCFCALKNSVSVKSFPDIAATTISRLQSSRNMREA